MKSTAIANSNIALVKYWGKKDSKLFLPNNSSISMTVDEMFTKTTVDFGNYPTDEFYLNGKRLTEGEEYKEVTGHLDLIRQMAGEKRRARVYSENNFPTAAGLASSASGFAALSLAGSKAAGLELDYRELSILARRGSGSASRSIEGGFVEWVRGERLDGADSYGVQIAPPEHWPEFRMVVAVTQTGEKKVKSRAGMAQTVATSPYYHGWLSTVGKDLENVRKGIREKNFRLVGETAESNCLKMHATMLTTTPPIIYWNPTTVEVMHAVQDWRDDGLQSYFTIDGGPQVKVLCLEKDLDEVEERLKEIKNIKNTIVGKPGYRARLVEDHLF